MSKVSFAAAPSHAGVLAATLAPVGIVEIAPADPPAPRKLATKASHVVVSSHSDKESWQKVESNKSRWQWLKVARRPVPDDIPGGASTTSQLHILMHDVVSR
jgi:hypothetical protein